VQRGAVAHDSALTVRRQPAITDLIAKESIMLNVLSPMPLMDYIIPGGGLVNLAVLFFIVALLAYVLGAKGVAGFSAAIGRTLLFVFLVLAVLAFLGSYLNH
jgi:uncharacterized membrane protein YtjA (UPF0391 family)